MINKNELKSKIKIILLKLAKFDNIMLTSLYLRQTFSLHPAVSETEFGWSVPGQGSPLI